MPRTTGATKDRILSAAYELFYKEGFARAGMDGIAGAAGVTKRTLYYHFESKDALAAAVLDRQHLLVFARFEKWGTGPVRTPGEFLVSLFDQIEVWASEPRWLGSGFTRLTMELANLPGHPVRQAAHRHKSAVENWMAGRLRELGVHEPEELARGIMLLIEGCLSLILIHGDTTYAKSAARAALRLADRYGA